MREDVEQLSPCSLQYLSSPQFSCVVGLLIVMVQSPGFPAYPQGLQWPLPLSEGYCAVSSALARWLVQRWDKPHLESLLLRSLDILLSLKISLGESEEQYRHEYGCVFKVLGVSVELSPRKYCPPWCEEEIPNLVTGNRGFGESEKQKPFYGSQ